MLIEHLLALLSLSLHGIVHKLDCLKRPTRNAPPTSCNTIIAELWNLNSACIFWAISLTTHWKGSHLIRKSMLVWYFFISLNALTPLFTLFILFPSSLSSLTFSFLFSASPFFSVFHFMLFSQSLTLPSSILLYECYVKAGSMCLQISYCNCYLFNVVSTSPVVWSQVRWFFLMRIVFCAINHDEITWVILVVYWFYSSYVH